MPLDSIKPYMHNAKTHPEEQILKLMDQIDKTGFDVPITVDKSNVIITGHGRLIAANRLKMKEVPVIVRDDLDEYEVIAKRLADNKVAESNGTTIF